ncbi:MAG: DNA topoisomerase IV subunit A [Actinomycetales bacterium]|nr:DNA topoisomerase IV subunit A [Actinomycetales bacterium]
MARRSTPTPPPVPERIVDIDVSAEMQSSFLEYAYSVIYARALPDARDGLKPVQRRILFRMAAMGLRPDRGHVKSARVVGDVMGALHPHGDGAIYDALVRMAQSFAMRVPLVDGHGNFGSLDDGPAAHRYTECRLTQAAMDLTANLDEDVVDFIANYDGRETEPVVLPAAFPSMLVNGAAGIAVGMATTIAPHNLVEVVKAARLLIDKPDASLAQLMKIVPGPDFPTGGVIIGTDGIRDAYETGRGTFRVRARASVEQVSARREGIVVTELPYNVGPERVIEKIKDAVESKKLQGVADVRDLSDSDHGLRLVIEVKSGFNPQAVLANLYKQTPMEESFAVNAVALVDGQPRTLGLKEMLTVYLEHRFEVVRRRCQHRRDRAAARLHLVEGLLIAILDIDEVIALIRASDDAAHARERLIAVFDLSPEQANYILEMPLRRLTKMSRLELESEKAELLATIEELQRVLADDAVLRGLVSDELAETSARHGSPRRSSIAGESDVVAVTDVPLEVADEACVVVLTATGKVLRCPVGTATSAKPGKHSAARAAVTTTTRADFGLITNQGRVIRHSAMETPALGENAADFSGGASAASLAPLRSRESVVGLTTLAAEGAGLVLATALGVVKRVVPDIPSAAADWQVIRLDDKDEVVFAADLAAGDEELVFITSDAQLLRFSASLVRPQGRPAGGVAAISLAEGAQVVAAAAIPSAKVDHAFVTSVALAGSVLPGTASGTCKVSPLAEYPRKGRATGGVRCHKFLKGEDVLSLAAVTVDLPLAHGTAGAVVPLPAPRQGKRDASGEPLEKVVTCIGARL